MNPLAAHACCHHPRKRVIQYSLTSVSHSKAAAYWMPAFAGMTVGGI
jgi:hypothetical protein